MRTHIAAQTEPPGEPRESPWEEPLPAPSEPPGEPQTTPWEEEQGGDE
jgi:hypothetical protein